MTEDGAGIGQDTSPVEGTADDEDLPAPGDDTLPPTEETETDDPEFGFEEADHNSDIAPTVEDNSESNQTDETAGV